MLLKVKALPVRFTPSRLVVLNAPLKVVVPVPAVCVMLATLTAADVVTLFALEIVSVFSGCTAPTAPVKVMLPAPAARVRFLVLSASPFKVLLNVIAPPAVVKVALAELFLTTATGNTNGLFAVVIFAPKKMVPVEEKLTALETILLGMLILPPVKESEANSLLEAVPMEASVIAPLPALSVTVRKFPVTASSGERVIAPPPELRVKFVPVPSVIEGVEKEIGVLLLVKVVRAPELKVIKGAV